MNLTTLLKENFETKKLLFREKHKAYSGYLEAFQESVICSTEENRQRVVYWHKRIELVAPENINEVCQKMYGPDYTKNNKLRDELVKCMRQDLNS